MNKVANLFNVREEEFGMVMRLFFYSVLIGFGRIFSLISGQSLFLENYGAAELPYVYIAAGIATICIGTFYFRLGKLTQPVTMVKGNLLFMTLVCFILYAILQLDAKWPSMVAFGWFFLLFQLQSLAFWNLASLMLDIRQGKRLFALITSGEVFALALGGLASTALSSMWHPSNLFLLAMICHGIAFIEVIFLARIYSDKLRTVAIVPEALRKKENTTGLKLNSYTILLILYFAISEFILIFLDNAFNDGLKRYATDTVEIVKILGNFSAIAALIGLFTRSFLAGWVIHRYGLIVALVALPMFILVNSAMTVGGALAGSFLVMFYGIYFARLSDKVLRGVQYSSLRTLYKPLLERASSTQTFVDGIAIPSTFIMAGCILLVLYNYLHVGLYELAYVLIFLCSIWLLIAVRTQISYARLLPKTLIHRKVDNEINMRMDMEDVGEAMDDEEMRSLIRKELLSDKAFRVIHALDYLEQAGDEVLKRSLLPLLSTSDPNVRLQVLERIERFRYESAYDALEVMLKREKDERTKTMLLRVLCVISSKGLKKGIDMLEAEEESVQKGAMVGLLRSGKLEGIVYAGAALMTRLGSPIVNDRIFAAQVLEEANIGGFYHPVRKLLADPDFEVKEAALKATATIKNPILINDVAQNLVHPSLHGMVATTLLAFGDQAMDTIRRTFEKHDTNISILKALIRTAGLIRSERSIRFLKEQLDYPHMNIRQETILSLKAAGFRCDKSDIPMWEKQIDREMENMRWILMLINSLSHIQNSEKIKTSLVYEIQVHRQRIFALLSFRFNRKKVNQAWYNYSLKHEEKRIYALEMLETIVPREYRLKIMPFIESDRWSQMLKRIKGIPEVNQITPIDPVNELLKAGHEKVTLWTRCCAIEYAGNYPANKYTKALVKYTVSLSTEISCTAYLAILKLLHTDPFLYQKIMDTQMPEFIEKIEYFKEHGALDYVTNTSLLKSFDLFSPLAESNLAGIVHMVEVVNYLKGTIVYQKGEVDQSIYLILKGKIRIMDEDMIKVELSAGDMFGESTCLVKEPHKSSAVVYVDVKMFRLRQNVLYHLISINSDVARKLFNSILDNVVGPI